MINTDIEKVLMKDVVNYRINATLDTVDLK